MLGYDRKLGIDIGDHRIIDEVEADGFTLAAEALRISPRMMGRLAHEVADSMGTALDALFREHDSVVAEIALRILDDAMPRLAALRAVAQQRTAVCLRPHLLGVLGDLADDGMQLAVVLQRIGRLLG